MFSLLRGIERFTIELARALAKQGVKVHIITWKNSRDWPWGTVPANIVLHALPLPRYFAAFWAGISYPFILQKIKPDILNLNYTWHGEEIAVNFFSKYLATNLILHSPAELISNRYLRIQKSQIDKKIKQVVAVSNYVAQGAKKYIGSLPIVIPNGVDTNIFRPSQCKNESRQRLKISIEAPVLVSVAALEERKGIHKVLTALVPVVREFPNLIYCVAGDGVEKNKLTMLAKELGLSQNTRFLGPVQDTLLVYHAADLFLFLSRGEAFGIALAEAMSCGLPIVAANCPPFDEVANPDGTSFVDDQNPQQISETILSLLREPVRREQMGKENRRYAEDHYDWDKIAAQYLQLFVSELADLR